MLFFTPDPDAATRFYAETLGFKISDRVPGVLSFMRCTTDHHNIAFAKSSHRGFHHASYEVGSFDEVGMGGMWMRERGWSDKICRAILSHADYANVSRETPMEKTLYAVDELSSFIIAVALVRPTKNIHDVDVRAVKKKMKDKAFARAVNRDDITRGAQQLSMPLDEVITEIIAALKADAERLGLRGIAS